MTLQFQRIQGRRGAYLIEDVESERTIKGATVVHGYVTLPGGNRREVRADAHGPKGWAWELC